MPGRERERDRERDNAIGRSEFDRLQKGHEMLEAQVERVAAVAVRVASDAGEARADLQLVFFLQGRSRARVLETIAKYNDDKPGVQDGAKEKGAPLKCYIYDFPTEPSIGNRGKLAVLSAFRVRSGELKMQRSCRRCRSRSRLRRVFVSGRQPGAKLRNADADGDFLLTRDQRLRQWEEHFTTALNVEKSVHAEWLAGLQLKPLPMRQSLDATPTLEDMLAAISQLKGGKHMDLTAYCEDVGLLRDRAGRGTSDMLFTLRVAMDVARIKSHPLRLLFVDLAKSYDSVSRGLGQGCCVAPTLFNIFLAAVSGNGCMVDGRLDWPCRIDGILRLHLDPGWFGQVKYTHRYYPDGSCDAEIRRRLEPARKAFWRLAQARGLERLRSWTWSRRLTFNGDARSWVLVFSFTASAAGRELRGSLALAGVFSRNGDGAWPDLGFKMGVPLSSGLVGLSPFGAVVPSVGALPCCRVAMLAAMGYITPEYVRFPGYCSPTAGLKFSEIPNGLAALGKVPAAGWTQIFLFLGLIEKGLFTYDPTRAPGDYKNAGVLGVPNGSTMAPGDGRTRKLNSELANGRLAMMAIIGMFFQDGLTGSAWGDWASYTDSPLRAFENELGVQAPVGYWDPMGMSKDGDVKTFRRRREAELKNGRVAMFATMGFITPEYFRFPGYLSPAKSIKFADVPNGLAALGKVPLTGWIQIFLFCGMVDFGLYRADDSRDPGDYENAGILGVPNASGPMSDAEGRKRNVRNHWSCHVGLLSEVTATGWSGRKAAEDLATDVFYFRDRFGCHRRCSCTFERLHLRWGACDVFSADQPFASHFCSNCGIYIYQGGCSKQNCLFSSGRCCSCCFDGYWQEGAVREHQTTAGFQVLSHHPHC
ncbi:Fucoxanthin-chlorophyll a-c binding protein F [Durusdinium trenchii]|uniref:Chloroplastic n=1 Tax=Durusdinium trenchii TaxID=1381693 RepID=A0ABP0SSC0_9DINO